MKKIIALLLAVLMLLTLASCGKKNASESEEQTTAAETEAQTETEEEEKADIANPWTEVSADDIYGYIGYSFGEPQGAEEIKYFWNETVGIAEMQFVSASGDTMTARAKKTGAPEDISGLNNDFTGSTDCFIKNNGAELRGDYFSLETVKEHVRYGLWFYTGTGNSYSFSLGCVQKGGFSEDFEQCASEVFLLDEPAEYTLEYWEAKYPGENICPFYIEVDGVEYSYYRVSGLDESTMKTWINTPCNWNGWHLVGDDIVNGDGTFKMTADWSGDEPEQAFSSNCTVTTEPYEAK